MYFSNYRLQYTIQYNDRHKKFVLVNQTELIECLYELKLNKHFGFILISIYIYFHSLVNSWIWIYTTLIPTSDFYLIHCYAC